MWRTHPAPPGFESDGCTVPFIFKPLYRRFLPACRWHDWARRHLVHYGVTTPEDADWAFRTYMRELGAWQPLLQITWLVVKATRGKYSRTLPVPPEWMPYVFPHKRGAKR